MQTVRINWRLSISSSVKLKALRPSGNRFSGVSALTNDDAAGWGRLYALAFSMVLGIVGVTLSGCTDSNKSIKTSAGYPPVTLKPSDLPTHAVGDRLTFDNPEETWTIVAIRDGLINWRSSLKAEKITVFDPVLPPIIWNKADGTEGSERLTAWDKSLFPLKKHQKITFKSKLRHKGTSTHIAYTWKCYSGGPRKVNVKAGEFPAYPVFCRRSDGRTRQSFYSPDVNGPLLITTRKRPAPAVTRELVEFEPGPGPRIAATGFGDLPKGWALAAVDGTARARVGRQTPAQLAAAADRKKSKTAASRVSSGSRSVTSPISSPPPTIPASPKILPPKSAVARSSVQEALSTVAIGAPQSPIISTSKVAQSPRPNVTRSTSHPAANAGKRAQVAKSSRPALPSIKPPNSVFGRRSSPPPPVIALPTPTRKSNKAKSAVRRAAPSANTTNRSADRVPREPRRTVTRSSGAAFGVQLGSYAKRELAIDGWKVLQRRYDPLLKNWGHLVKHVDLGSSKGEFYRLIAGPTQSRASAAALCTAIKARRKSCLVRSLKN